MSGSEVMEIELPNTGQTKILFDVFLTDPFIVDQFTYKCWLQGFDEDETSFRRYTQQLASTPLSVKGWSNMILHDTHDQFRNFRLLEHCLKNPNYLDESLFQIAPNIQRMMVESYYAVDDELMRELVGRKLTNGLRRDLAGFVEGKLVKLASCWRQFDNLRRVYKKAMVDVKAPCGELIQRHFCLSKELASKYTRIVFMCVHRFDTTKKKLQSLSYGDFDKFASVLMEHWTDPTRPLSIDIDTKLKDDVRDLKAYIFSSKDIPDKYRRAVKARFNLLNLTKDTLKAIDGKFKSCLKAIVNIGANISDTKQFKDIFEDLIEKIVEPCCKQDITLEVVDKLFIFMEETFETNILDVLSLRHGQRFNQNWRRYLEGLRGVIIHLYPLFQN